MLGRSLLTRRRRLQPARSIDRRILDHLRSDKGVEADISQIAADLLLTDTDEIYEALKRLRADGLISCRSDPGSENDPEEERPWGPRRLGDTD